MSENYKFNQHKACEFFPCHKIKDENSFNCLFCYCPLYALKDECGGNFVYSNSIKDCSQCTLPHGLNGYEHIMSKIDKVLELGKK